jgi:hypothetical protein
VTDYIIQQQTPAWNVHENFPQPHRSHFLFRLLVVCGKAGFLSTRVAVPVLKSWTKWRSVFGLF